MVAVGPGWPLGSPSPSQTVSKRMRAGLGLEKAPCPQSCQDTKRSSKSREEDEIPHLRDPPWRAACRRGLTLPGPRQPGKHLHRRDGPECRGRTVPDHCVMSSVTQHRQGDWSLHSLVLCTHVTWSDTHTRVFHTRVHVACSWVSPTVTPRQGGRWPAGTRCMAEDRPGSSGRAVLLGDGGGGWFVNVLLQLLGPLSALPPDCGSTPPPVQSQPGSPSCKAVTAQLVPALLVLLRQCAGR